MSDTTGWQSDPDLQELLSFQVGEQEYSVDIKSVREIRGWTRATPLPHAPPHLRGVINLRGTVLPIIDLGKRLGIEVAETTERNVIIVVLIGPHTVGLLVDAVSDILPVSGQDLHPPPSLDADDGRSCVKALTIVEGRMLRVLDLDIIHPTQTGEAA